MPTGYTADVADGKVTDFRTFALRCARAFGATIMQRDDPQDEPPKHREPTDYHTTRVAEARAALPVVMAMSVADADAAAAAEYEKELASHVEHVSRMEAEDQRYRDMQYEVRQWTPPTKDHQELKAFMLQQLDTSMSDYRPTPPRRLTGAEWIKKERARLEYDISYHTRNHLEELERCAKANAWIDALYASLPTSAVEVSA